VAGAALLGILLLLALLLVSAIESCTRRLSDMPGDALGHTAERAAEAGAKAVEIFREVFGLTPELRINQRVVQGQVTPIAEFAVLQETYALKYTWIHRWMGSSKSIELTGDFTAKAGFDLKEQFLVLADAETGQVHAYLPAAKILSVEPTNTQWKTESGWWNRLQDADKTEAERVLRQAAREEAAKLGLLEKAETEATRRLQELFDRNNQQVVFEYRRPENSGQTRQSPLPSSSSESTP
jgi:hypothetical protein